MVIRTIECASDAVQTHFSKACTLGFVNCMIGHTYALLCNELYSYGSVTVSIGIYNHVITIEYNVQTKTAV